MSVPSVLRAIALTPYRVVFYPFLAIRRGVATLGAGRGPWRTWVTPSVQVGGFLYPSDVDALVKEGVGAVVNVSRELVDPTARLERAGIAYLQIPCWDARVPELPDALRGVDFISEQIAKGRKVHVHCASGVGRSVSLVLCYLCTREGMGVEDAIASVKSVRRRVSLSRVQRAFVDDYLKAYPPSWRPDAPALAPPADQRAHVE